MLGVIILICSMVLFIVFTIRCIVKDKVKISVILGEAISIVGLIIGGWSIYMMTTIETTESTVVEEYKLISFLSYGKEISFLYEAEEGGYKQKVLTNVDATIYETDEVSPVIVKYKINYKYPNEFAKLLCSDSNCSYYYVVYLPEGSIVSSYTVKLE